MPSPFSPTPSEDVPLSGISLIDALLSGSAWESVWNVQQMSWLTSLSYSFITTSSTSRFVYPYSDDQEYLARYALTAAQKGAVASVLTSWSAVANITFSVISETVDNVGDLRFGGYSDMDEDILAWAYLPSDSPTGGDVWVGPATSSAQPVKGSYDYLTFLHEIGHALGLKHDFEAITDNSATLPAALDDVLYTVMSYTDYYSFLPTTPMVLDIAAIQYIYGANTSWKSGNTLYRWASSQSIFETIWDGGGIDTIDASNQLAAVNIDLNQGAYSTIGKSFIDYWSGTFFNRGLAIAYGAEIENAIGSAYNDTLTGNELANVLDGRGGLDRLNGGAGDDTYILDHFAELDLIQEFADEGSDTVRITYANGSTTAQVVDLSGQQYLENIVITGAGAFNLVGNDQANRLVGNAAANILDAGAGNDRLDGGKGADLLKGGLDDDTYVVDNPADRIEELVGQGSDTVESRISWILGAHLESLVLTGQASVNATGNELSNSLLGNAGKNILDGLAGTDEMAGGKGNDTYIVDHVGDLVIEYAGEGIDTIRSSLTYTLSDDAQSGFVENLILTGAADSDGSGNALANSITGNDGANRLDGGAGVDKLAGGKGNDTYAVELIQKGTGASATAALQDSISEAAGAGIDTLELYLRDALFLSVATTLQLAANLENLDVSNTATTWLNLTGNAANNALIGNAADNIINGGLGNDTLMGEDGNDILIGGRGSDILYGGTGMDRFVFTALNELGLEAQRDVIADFDASQGDLIDLSKLDANLLVSGKGAFTFIGEAGFTAAGQLRFVDKVLYGNINADLNADFEIQLLGVSGLEAHSLALT